MSRSTAATHGDAGTAKLIAHGCPGNAQLGTDLAQSTNLGVQVGCTLNVHRATVTSHGRIVRALVSSQLVGSSLVAARSLSPRHRRTNHCRRRIFRET
jgi:hypothetical protein